MESNTITIVDAQYIEKYSLLVYFSDKTSRSVDFGRYIVHHPNILIRKFKDLRRFKRFKIENGNIVWGKDWDLIFPVEQIYSNSIC